jgi:hypothetical protein
MGFEAGRFVAETVIALIESNPTAPDGKPFYSSGRGNQTTSALSENALAQAVSAMEVSWTTTATTSWSRRARWSSSRPSWS